MKNVKIFTGQGSTDLAKKIVKSYFKHSEPIKLGKKAYTEFSDGEFKSFPDESVRDCYVFIVVYICTIRQLLGASYVD